MIEVDLKQSGVLEGLSALPALLTKRIDSLLSDYAEKVASRARRVHIYRKQTGNLERSVKTKTGRRSATVYIDEGKAPYALPVIDRTSNNFLTDAYEFFEGEIDEAIDQMVENAIDESGVN